MELSDCSSRTPSLRDQLGELMLPMLIGMSERGPESAGLAVFTEAVGGGASQVQRVLRERDRRNGRLSRRQAIRELGADTARQRASQSRGTGNGGGTGASEGVADEELP